VELKGKWRGKGFRGLVLLKQPDDNVQNKGIVGPLDLPRLEIDKMLADLRQEREHIEQAIETLERLAIGRGEQPSRPIGKNKAKSAASA
jgi:hypothetical protein